MGCEGEREANEHDMGSKPGGEQLLDNSQNQWLQELLQMIICSQPQ